MNQKKLLIKSFRNLFLCPNDINHADLDEKVFAFQLILKTLKKDNNILNKKKIRKKFIQ